MHAQGHIRETFLYWIEAIWRQEADIADETFAMWNDELITIPQLLSKLCHCTDVVPVMARGLLVDLGLEPKRISYAAYVRLIRQRRTSG